MNEIERALVTLEEVFSGIVNADISMPLATFEKRIRIQVKRTGLPFDDDWLKLAKQKLANPKTPRWERNMILMEADPPAMRPLLRKFNAALGSLVSLAPTSAGYLKKFLAKEIKDFGLREYLRKQISSIARAVK